MRKLIKIVEGVASGRSFYLCLGIIILIGLIFRVLYLSADPPQGITKSQDFSTDPPQYTYFAHNLVSQGEANPYHDPRFSQWEYSSQNLLALGVYALFGTGRVPGNVVAVIFNLLSIWLLALAIKNFGSRIGALFFAIFAAFGFTLIWFARTPFLESSENFWLCIAVYFFSLHESKQWAVVAAGASCAIGAFFGKMIALYMLGPFTALWIVLYFTADEDRKELWRKVAYYYGGFIAITLIWFLAIYLPAQSRVGGYFAEQAIGLYGAPKALDSIGQFFFSLNTLLWDRNFFTKMPVITTLAFFGGCIALYWLARSGKSNRWFRTFNPGWVLITFWFAVGFLSLFPWNYRPLRYQTTIMFPAMALAAFCLGYAWEHLRTSTAKGKKKSKSNFRYWQLLLTCGLTLMPLLACFLFLLNTDPKEFYFKPFLQSPVAFSILLIVVGALLGAIWRLIIKSSWFHGDTARLLGLLVVLAFAAWNTAHFIRWANVRQYSLMTAERDIAAITNEGAVLSGPYGPALALDNDRGAVIHMFGVVKVDKNLFSEFPITHLAMDEGNEKRAREDYPDLMAKAWPITHYILRGVAVKVYNIAEGSPNPTAEAYVPTDYELAQKQIAAGNQDSAQVYMTRFMQRGVANYSADLYVGDALTAVGNYQQALDHFRKAQDFSPGDPLSAFYIGNSLMAIGSKNSSPAYFDSALVYYRIAQKAYPGNEQIDNLISQLERRKQ